ncbi:hypothetical protein ACFQMA_19425 [Halosimplex aquaticum]|uniref:Uncharacterized protein n=1 Tax=Halosimplex aquaticum TaxID=3026162 RepID=A0ABD5Y3M5_9EURY|nr:hypothetical protein [Halosimplex aquaticum]
MSLDVALALLQLVALTIPPIAVLIQMLRKSENLPWRLRKLSFGLVIVSVVSFIATGVSVLTYFLVHVSVPGLLVVGLLLTVVGLIPFALFTGVLYKEHKAAHGP